MRKYPIVLDLETKHTFRDYVDIKKLGVSVVAIYDYRDNQSKVFWEKEISKLFPLLENCSYIIGFNVKSFDLPILQGYYSGNINHFAVFDILEDVKTILGRRLALNDLLLATLDKKKTGHGLKAIDYFKERKWEELKKYCLDDVLLTTELFNYGAQKGEIYFLNEKGKVSIRVNWKKYLEDFGKDTMALTLPF